MNKCPSCGTANPAGSARCRRCAQSLYGQTGKGTGELPDWAHYLQAGIDALGPSSPLTDAVGTDLTTPSPASSLDPDSQTDPLATLPFRDRLSTDEMPQWLQSMMPPPTDLASNSPTSHPVFREPAEKVDSGELDWHLQPDRAEPLDQPELSPDASSPQIVESGGAAEIPDWLQVLETGPQPNLADPGLSALGPSPPASAGPFVDETAVLPKTDRSQGQGKPLKGAGNLEPAGIPERTETVRFETPAFRPEPSGRQEMGGPLDGLRGVLPAEPAAAMPRTPLVLPGPVAEPWCVDLGATAQVSMATGGKGGLAGRIRAEYLERALIVAFLLLAVVAPVLLDERLHHSFLPAPQPGDLPAESPIRAMFGRIEGIQPGQTVVVAFEYGPAAAGELDRSGRVVLEHLLARGANLVAVSTQPAGPSLAEMAWQSLRVEDPALRDDRFVDLGYVPGGAVAVNGLLANARQAAPRDAGGSDRVWMQPAVAGLQRFQDAPVILVVTGDFGSLRAWLEQVSVLPEAGIGRTTRPDVLAVVSASLSPLAEGYYARSNGPLGGMVAGLAGADVYEQLVGRPGAAGATRDARGFGGAAVAALLIAGLLLTAVQWSLSRLRSTLRARRTHGKVPLQVKAEGA